MNALLKRAQRIVENRRNDAIAQYEDALDALRTFDDWNQCEQALRRAQLSYATAEGKRRDEIAGDIANLMAQRQEIAQKHGYVPADLQPKFFCPICQDRGYVDGQRCQCLSKELRKLLVAESNLDNDDRTFANSTEKNKHNKAVYRRVEKICNGQSDERNILLTGKTGTGKTYLLAAAANACIEREMSVLFVTAYTLNRLFLEYHLGDLQTKYELLDNFYDVDVLIIDDLGTENILRNVTVENLFALLNQRLMERKRTFISTNLDLAGLRDRYDERIFSRIVDGKITFTAELVGNDKRVLL